MERPEEEEEDDLPALFLELLLPLLLDTILLERQEKRKSGKDG